MALVLKTADQRKKVFLNFSLLLLRIRGAWDIRKISMIIPPHIMWVADRRREGMDEPGDLSRRL
jgi:hypothetical protein